MSWDDMPERPLDPPEIDDSLLDPFEYEEACEEAERRTQEHVLQRIGGLDHRARIHSINGLLFDDERYQIAQALINVYEADDVETLRNAALCLKHQVERALIERESDEVKPVDPESVLREWHQPPDTGYDQRKALQEA